MPNAPEARDHDHADVAAKLQGDDAEREPRVLHARFDDDGAACARLEAECTRAEIAERGDAPQQTEVFGLEAQVLAVVEEDAHYVASVRFTGSTRDQHGAVPEDLDEIWHLTKPRTGLGGWVIAGIQQTNAG